MKSYQWNVLVCNEKNPMKIPGSSEKLSMKHAGLQWKFPNEILWGSMKSYWEYQGILWKDSNHKEAWNL